jgi:putative hydrolase of the HAD superfamily
VIAAVIFDLDETLVLEDRPVEQAFEATARYAAEFHELVVSELATGARARARELWWAAPTGAYCRRVGFASWEGLWCRFEGDAPEVRRLREWAPSYRREAWRLALADGGVEDDLLAEELAERFIEERRARRETFADAASVLAELGVEYRLAILTNGPSCLQREKLAASGLERHFTAVVASGDLEVAKPAPEVFAHTLRELGVDPTDAQAVMVGDSVERDIDGALGFGIHAVWLNRYSRPGADGRAGAHEIASLTELSALIRSLGAAPPAGTP